MFPLTFSEVQFTWSCISTNEYPEKKHKTKQTKSGITRRHGNPTQTLDLNKSDLLTTGLPGISSPT